MPKQLDQLRRVQQRFWQLISAPTGVAAGLRQHSTEDPSIEPLNSWICAPDQAAAIERLDVYADMYFYRLLDILQGDYPKLQTLIGDAPFHNLITDYLLSHPSTFPTVRHVGSRLPQFLRGHQVAQTWPCAGNLADLEWARLEVFDCIDPQPLEAQALAQIPPEAWGGLRIELHSAVKLLAVEHRVDQLWGAIHNAPDQAELTCVAQPTTLILWRQGFVVWHRALSETEARALSAVHRGQNFGVICEAASLAEDDANAAAQRVLGFLQLWLADGLIGAVHV